MDAPGPSNSDDAQLDESAEALLAAMEKYNPIVRMRRFASRGSCFLKSIAASCALCFLFNPAIDLHILSF